MNAKQVAAVLTRMFLKFEANPYGFSLATPSAYGYNLEEPVRIQCGSGIAGNGNRWALVEIRSGKHLSGPCKRPVELKRALTEWLAGPKPVFPGKWYAKLNHNRFGDSYIWVQTRMTVIGS